ncbi:MULTISPECIES: MFS transporter [unclassified Haladaptatus]|uniref:MFS transporter n=1 Tax=unclassified Haladaptatus TaxID=2622732 RepID=UPI0023E8CF26|nr:MULTISPECIES: MFS transporter [unclassified Haladaptatus]
MARTQTSIILRYYFYMAGSSFGFIAPIWVVLLESRNLNFTEIMVLDAIFAVTLVLGEVPTGYLGDRIGRRTSLILSAVIVSGSSLAFAVAQRFETFLVVYFIWAVAITMRSGNDSAWLYDTLKQFGNEATFTRVRGRGFSVLLITGAVSSLAAGALAEVDIRYPFVAFAILGLVSALVLLTMPEPTIESGAGETLSIAHVRDVIQRKLFRPPLRAFVMFVALFYAATWSVEILVQPVSTRLGLGFGELGVMYATFAVFGAIASGSADWIQEQIGVHRWLMLATIGLGASLLLILAVPLVALPSFLLMHTAFNAALPMVEQHLNDRMPSVGRATVLSAISMAVSVASVPLKLGSGALADATSPAMAVVGLGAILLAGGLYVVVANVSLSGGETAVLGSESD